MDNNEVIKILEKGDKSGIEEMIINNPDVIAEKCIFNYIYYFKLDIVKIIVECYEKINRKLDIRFINRNINTIASTALELKKYIRYLKKHNYYTYDNKMNMQSILLYHIILDYTMQKKINRLEYYYNENIYTKNFFIINNNAINRVPAFSNIRLNYIMYCP